VNKSNASFYTLVLGLLNKFYLEKTTTCTSKDPEQITPAIKSKIRCRNRLVHAGQVDEAGALAEHIVNEIM
jgi:hypothetical protein